MQTIEIDFDVFKELTIRRTSEEVTYNDVLRSLLKLGPSKKLEGEGHVGSEGSQSWVAKGIVFPHGTEFRSTYKGQVYYGKVENGALVVNGKRFNSPSAAAREITNNSVNGWIFWECKMLGENSWKLMSNVR